MSEKYCYIIALGCNQGNLLLGHPRHILRHAIDALECDDIDVFAVSAIAESRPVGPSQRSYANAAVMIASHLAPDALLERLQNIERHFGRKRMGQRWRGRILDLDIILWSAGCWSSTSPALIIPHALFANRSFVLAPCAQIAGNWRDPLTGLSLHQLNFRNRKEKLLTTKASLPSGSQRITPKMPRNWWGR